MPSNYHSGAWLRSSWFHRQRKPTSIETLEIPKCQQQELRSKQAEDGVQLRNWLLQREPEDKSNSGFGRTGKNRLGTDSFQHNQKNPCERPSTSDTGRSKSRDGGKRMTKMAGYSQQDEWTKWDRVDQQKES